MDATPSKATTTARHLPPPNSCNCFAAPPTYLLKAERASEPCDSVRFNGAGRKYQNSFNHQFDNRRASDPSTDPPRRHHGRAGRSPAAIIADLLGMHINTAIRWVQIRGT